MRHNSLIVVLLLAAVVSAVSTLRSPTAFGTSLVVAAQDAVAVEAALSLDRTTRRLIQQGLRNENFDPGAPDGLFGPRTRAAITAWQAARGHAETGYLDSAQAEALQVAGASPAVPAGDATDISQPRAGASGAPRAEADTVPAMTLGSSQPRDATTPSPPGAAALPEPAPTNAVQTTGSGQLPPEIMLDSYLLRAEESVRHNDLAGVRGAMDQLLALEEKNDIQVLAEYHYRYASVWTVLQDWDRALASIVRYLELVGRDGERYLDALRLMNDVTAEIEATELREAARTRERAARDSVLSAAREVISEMEFVRIPAGQFRMGSKSDLGRALLLPIRIEQPNWGYKRAPLTDVRITHTFELGRFEVTQSQWEIVMGGNPSHFAGCTLCPVEQVSWDEVQHFISLLNEAEEGRSPYRLPTEAEWEYAARAGNEVDRYTADVKASAWCRHNSGERTRPVGLKRPNGFGLYDTLGNVAELVHDWLGRYPGGTAVDPVGPSWPTLSSGLANLAKVARGGHYFSEEIECELAERSEFLMGVDGSGGYRQHQTGFRLVRTAR